MIRDQQSNALISVDKSALDKYRLERRRIGQVEQLIQDVAALQQKLNDLCAFIGYTKEEK